MPGSDGNLSIVLLESLELLHDPDIMDLQRVILRSGQKPVAVDWVPPYLGDSLVVRLHAMYVLT